MKSGVEEWILRVDGIKSQKLKSYMNTWLDFWWNQVFLERILEKRWYKKSKIEILYEQATWFLMKSSFFGEDFEEKMV